MQQPLTALLIAPDPDRRRRIERGEQTVTIRTGHRDYRVGQPVMLCCHIEPWCVKALIGDVRHVTLGAITDRYMREYMTENDCDGLPTELADFRKFYPRLTTESPVTIVHWWNVCGKLTENA